MSLDTRPMGDGPPRPKREHATQHPSPHKHPRRQPSIYCSYVDTLRAQLRRHELEILHVLAAQLSFLNVQSWLFAPVRQGIFIRKRCGAPRSSALFAHRILDVYMYVWKCMRRQTCYKNSLVLSKADNCRSVCARRSRSTRRAASIVLDCSPWEQPSYIFQTTTTRNKRPPFETATTLSATLQPFRPALNKQ